MRKWLISFGMCLLIAGSAPAPIIMLLPDDCDDATIVRGVYDQQNVVQFRQQLNDFEKKLRPLKEKDFIALFGKSQSKPATNYAMPVAQCRMSGTGAVRIAVR